MSDSVGNRLKAERVKRGLTLEDITNATKMRPNFIKALEADDYAQFPSVTHARNFLSLYGKYLKVDVEHGVARLVTPAKMGIENYQYLNVERNEDTSYRPMRRQMHISSNPRSSEQTSRSLGIIAIAIVCLIVGVYLSLNLRRLNLATSSPVSSTAEASPTPLAIGAAPKNEPKYDRIRSPAPTPEPSSAPFYAPTLDKREIIKRRPWPRF